MQPLVRPPPSLFASDQQVVELGLQSDDLGLSSLGATLSLVGGSCFLVTPLAIPACGLLHLGQLRLQPGDLGVLFLGDRVSGSVGGLVVLHGLGQLVLQLRSTLLSAVGAVGHGAGPVVVDVLGGQIEAALEGGGQVGVRAQLLDELADLVEGLALLLLSGWDIGANQLDADDGAGAVAVALFEVSPSLVLVGCREVIGALGAVFVSGI